MPEREMFASESEHFQLERDFIDLLMAIFPDRMSPSPNYDVRNDNSIMEFPFSISASIALSGVVGPPGDTLV